MKKLKNNLTKWLLTGVNSKLLLQIKEFLFNNIPIILFGNKYYKKKRVIEENELEDLEKSYKLEYF